MTLTAEGLEIRGEDLRVDFGGIRALSSLDFSFRQGEILGLIGPNGAGKTTAVNVLTGFQRPTGGTLSLGSRNVTRWSPQALVKAGVARTFQNVRLYGALTGFENIEAAALGIGVGRREARKRASRVLEELGLSARSEIASDAFPFGEKRLLSIARALALEPRLLFLDEPAAGLSEAETDSLLEMILGIRKQYGCGVLVIEHDMRLIMRLCERIQVLDHGKTIAVGEPKEIREDAAVIAAYLGQATPDRGSTDA